MAPTRKSRSVNKRFSYEVSPTKDGENAKKSMQRKRKLSDMLGSQWSREELMHFYDAYRKYGKDWKKVAAVVRNRSVEMVEALYTMNKAYLSLPEGTASVVGLIAMMTDHYCNLEGSDSEQESNDGTGTPRKPQKRGRSKFRPNTFKGSEGHFLVHSQTVASSSGCLSLLKKRRSGGSRPRAVGKRTPRFPVSYSYEKVNGEKFFSPTRQGRRSKADPNDDDVAHEIALALAEASQRGGSPQVSQAPNRKMESVLLSPFRNSERMRAESVLTSAKLVGSEMDEDTFEGSLGSMEADNGDFPRDRSYLMETEDVGTVKAQKGSRLYGKKLEVDDSGNNHLDDIKEACSGTEEEQKLVAVRGKLGIEVTDGKFARSSSQVPRKRSKKVLFRRDESSAFDALQTLADLSLMMPATAIENESSVQVKEENDDLVDESGVLEAMPGNHQRTRPKSLGDKAKKNQLIPRFKVATLKTSKLGKVSVLDVSAIPEAKQETHQSITKMSRKKGKTLASKIPKTEAHIDGHPSESQEAEARDVGKKSISKGKRSSYNVSQQKQGKLVKQSEHSSSSTDPRKGEDSAVSTVPVHVANQPNLPTKVRSRRKMDLPLMLKDLKFSDEILNDEPNVPILSVHERELKFKEKLSNCLSNHLVRRWCTFEWFYSAVDYPWFAKREFVEYLYHVGLGHVPRLTRVEWGVIRSSLGKPRRFSEQFLKEEKEKLNHYRNSVRTHYTELRAGTREGLPTDLGRPLSVGQRVIAIHPRTREIHDGSVLTVDHTRCRVQFDRPELGVEFVTDIDCMPLNPLENMPALLAKHTVAVDKFFGNFNELKMNGQAKDPKLEGYLKFSPGENQENVDGPSLLSPSTYPMSNVLKQVAPTNAISQAKLGPKETANNKQEANSQPLIPAQIQAKEADVQALAELTCALDKKEAVVSELRRMNDDVLENQKDGDSALKDSEPFKKQYAAVLLQLNEANEQVSSALYCLRQRNTYQGNSPLMWPRPTVNFGDSGGLLSSIDHSASHTQESGSHANEIVESSRTKARTMVDAAMQAMSSLKGGGNTVERIEEAIDCVSNLLPLDDSCMVASRSSTPADPVNSSSASQNQLISCTLNSLHAPDPTLRNTSDRNEAQIPSELISHCVATLLMIQKCTERQFPPADVAQILDSAVTCLQPCCSQNLPVYAEIQKCMGIIRNQILALIPT
uniref:SANT domain-containing protein n=1 Tax=Davidia involucrata TaxID=16924 RepID=A0A5B6Z075_DAVIN